MDFTIRLPVIPKAFFSHMRWVACRLSSPEALERGVRWRHQLVRAVIWLRNRKGKIPSQRLVAARTGLHESHIKEHLNKLRSVGLLDHDELRAAEGDWDWYRKDRRGQPLYVRFPCPSPNCPLSGSEQMVLAAYTSFPLHQNVSSLERLTGLDPKTVRTAVRRLREVGEPRPGWFQAKTLPENADPLTHHFNTWIKGEGVPNKNRKSLLEHLKYLGPERFYALARRAKEQHSGDGPWLRLFYHMLKAERARVQALRDQSAAVESHSRRLGEEQEERDRREREGHEAQGRRQAGAAPGSRSHPVLDGTDRLLELLRDLPEPTPGLTHDLRDSEIPDWGEKEDEPPSSGTGSVNRTDRDPVNQPPDEDWLARLKDL